MQTFYRVLTVEGVVRQNIVAGAKVRPWIMRGLVGGTVHELRIGLYLRCGQRIM
jgi:hypothetical protein